MNKLFTNEEYEILARDVVGDIFYSNNSLRNKIATERQYAEIVIRKILDIDPDEEITLGSSKIKDCIKQSKHSGYLSKNIHILNNYGSEDTHSQKRDIVSEEDYERATDSLFSLIAYLFIDYFECYTFGSNNEIMSAFSILPTIIRYKTLSYLYSNDSNNISIIDKLVLIIYKHNGKQSALAWIEENRKFLEQTKVYTEETKKQIIEQLGEEYAYIICNNSNNMYLQCKEIIDCLDSNQIRVFRTFEEAMPLYVEVGQIEGNTQDINEFNDLMEFVYMGRRISI